VAAAVTGLMLVGCAGGGLHRFSGPGSRAVVGEYRGRVERADGQSRPCHALLFAHGPDRFHAELLGPFGGPQWIVDGGAGRMAVTAVGDGVAYAGAASPDLVAGVLGLPISAEQLVHGLLESSVAGEGWSLARGPGRPGALPQALELRSDEGVVRLRLRRWRALRGDGSRLGTGEPPPGIPVRPLEELASGDGSALFSGAARR